MKCYSCGYSMTENTLKCSNCGFVHPGYTGDIEHYEEMLQKIGAEYRQANNISMWKGAVEKPVTNFSTPIPLMTASVPTLLKYGNMALEDGEWLMADSFYAGILSQNTECAEAYLGKFLASKKVRTLAEYVDMVLKYSESITPNKLIACEEATEHIEVMTKQYSEYIDADTIRKLYSYNRTVDSSVEGLENTKNVVLQEMIGDPALVKSRQYATGDMAKEIHETLLQLESYMDEKIHRAKEADRQNIERLKIRYTTHISIMDQKVKELFNEFDEEESQAVPSKKHFENLSDITENTKHSASTELPPSFQNGDDDQKEKLKSNSRRSGIIAAVACVVGLAVLGYNSPSATWRLNTAERGSKMKFGSYEQDGNNSNGKEKIEWTILDKKDDKMLLISKYALDCKRFDEMNESVVWQNCSLCEWLNEDFVNDAFSENERVMLDKIFLLSTEAADEYFASDKERICFPTEYAIMQGANKVSWWWLCSSGNNNGLAAYVNRTGKIYYSGCDINDYGLVRPALWINLES